MTGGRTALGEYVPLLVDDQGRLVLAAGVSLSGADIQIGAVEIKNGATDQRALVNADGRLAIEPLGVPGVARQLTAGAASSNTVLTVGVARISIYARNADIRYVVGSSAQVANNATSHFIAQGERLDIDVPATPNIAVIRAAGATVDGILELTELS